MKALIFDFNGVIVDDEPIHFELFQKVLAEEGITLSHQDYYEHYLGMDDFGCLRVASRDQGKPLSEEKILELTERKNQYYQKVMEDNPPFVPGAKDFILQAVPDFALAVVSGALKREIEDLLSRLELIKYFPVLVAAEDVKQGKPHPEGYLKALKLLQKEHPKLKAEDCLVFEDSPWGLESAEAAGMPRVAIMTSFAKEDLNGALAYLKDFKNLQVRDFINSLK
ncbi:MAG: HAD family phosphatase [Deltaproteobacteria bacterium]|nr:HAD family phosphatase [Deltaproteobacteria bacterium]